jgi:hypothetical protein
MKEVERLEEAVRAAQWTSLKEASPVYGSILQARRAGETCAGDNKFECGRQIGRTSLRGLGDAALVTGLTKGAASAAARLTKTGAVPRAAGARSLGALDFEGAEAAYSLIRQADDVALIAENTGWRQVQVARVKEHLFFRTHQLDDAVRTFDADPLIANAWQRLQTRTHTPADMQLLRHELFESRFEGIFRTDYRTAHGAANRAGRPSGLE